MPLSILKVSHAYHPFVELGGPPVAVRAMAEGLARRGHRVTVLTVGRAMSAATGPQPYGVEAVYLRPVAGYRSLTLSPGLVRFCLRRLPEFDLAHIYGLYDLLGPVVAAFCRVRGLPFAVEPLGMYRPVARSVGAKRLYRFLVGRRLCERAARVIATSELERRQLLGEGLAPDRVAVRRNGIDLTPFAELPPRGRFRRDRGIASETRLILFLGRLAAVKSIPLLVRAFAALTPPSARLVIAGPHETPGDRQTLIDLTERLGVGSRVLFTGALYGAAKVEALVDADVLVLPSQSESFGIAAAEAMACGTPVIVTDQCGIAPYVHDRAGLVVPHEAAAVTAALQRLLGDAALAARCRAQGPVAARALSWDEPLQQLERLYHNVVAGGRQPRRRPAPRPA